MKRTYGRRRQQPLTRLASVYRTVQLDGELCLKAYACRCQAMSIRPKLNEFMREPKCVICRRSFRKQPQRYYVRPADDKTGDTFHATGIALICFLVDECLYTCMYLFVRLNVLSFLPVVRLPSLSTWKGPSRVYCTFAPRNRRASMKQLCLYHSTAIFRARGEN